jgi:hypothetical protein
MGSKVNVNSRTVVHAASDGVVTGFPNVCLTPAGSGPPVPVPYPNVARSSDASDGSCDVFVEGQSVMLASSCFAQSSGDEAGSAGGVASGCNGGAARFVTSSVDVQLEGQGVARLGDMMLLNCSPAPNTPSFALVQPPCPPPGSQAPVDGEDAAPGNDIRSVAVGRR